MLVLSRKKEEKIMIGDNIVIKVIDIKHNRVRLGIEAPKEIHILREEIIEEKPDVEEGFEEVAQGVD